MARLPKHLVITTAIAAALLAGCSSEEEEWAEEPVAVCTDKAGKRVEDAQCGTQVHNSGGSMMPAIFAWYYLSRGSRVPAYGTVPQGGSFKSTPGTSYKAASSVSRGGFGGSARSSGTSGRGFGG
jgi:hypothetical protein